MFVAVIKFTLFFLASSLSDSLHQETLQWTLISPFDILAKLIANTLLKVGKPPLEDIHSSHKNMALINCDSLPLVLGMLDSSPNASG